MSIDNWLTAIYDILTFGLLVFVVYESITCRFWFGSRGGRGRLNGVIGSLFFPIQGANYETR